jgi:hypothetical protein
MIFFSTGSWRYKQKINPILTTDFNTGTVWSFDTRTCLRTKWTPRKIFGSKNKNKNKNKKKKKKKKKKEFTGEWRKLHYLKLHNLRKMRWVGHVALMAEIRNAYKIFGWISEERDQMTDLEAGEKLRVSRKTVFHGVCSYLIIQS